MQFSIILPTYRSGPYLDEALASICAQTLPDWECWVIDDASPDDTAARADAWARRDPRIQVVRQSTRQGVLAARNRGIALSRGAWIKPLDHDDRLDPDTLARMAAAAAVWPDATVISVTARAIDARGRPQGCYAWVTQDTVWPPSAWVAANLLGFNPAWVPSCYALRRDVVCAVGGYRDPGLTIRHRDWGTDWEVLWRVGAHGPVVTLAAPGVDYRIHPDQGSQQHFGQAEVAMRAWLLSHFLDDVSVPDAWRRLAWGRHWSASALVAWQAWRTGDEAGAFWALDQWLAFPGPYAWEHGRVADDMAAWRDSIRHHATALPAPASLSWRLMRDTGWAINPAAVDRWLADPAQPIWGPAALIGQLVARWPAIRWQVVDPAQLAPGTALPEASLVLGPPGWWGVLWYAWQPAPQPAWPLVV